MNRPEHRCGYSRRNNTKRSTTSAVTDKMRLTSQVVACGLPRTGAALYHPQRAVMRRTASDFSGQCENPGSRDEPSASFPQHSPALLAVGVIAMIRRERPRRHHRLRQQLEPVLFHRRSGDAGDAVLHHLRRARRAARSAPRHRAARRLPRAGDGSRLRRPRLPITLQGRASPRTGGGGRRRRLLDPALWVRSSGNVWRAASVTWSPKQVFADGARLSPSTVCPSLPVNSFVWVSGSGLFVNVGGTNPGTHQAEVGHRLYGFLVAALVAGDRRLHDHAHRGDRHRADRAASAARSRTTRPRSRSATASRRTRR